MDVTPTPAPELLPTVAADGPTGTGDAAGNGKRLGVLSRLAPQPMKVVLNWGRRYSLWVFNFGLACCAIEFIAASMARHDFIRLGVIPFAPGPRQADLMIVSGTVTDKMAPAVKRLYEQMPEPKYVISFGACSNCGGPYWDSYSVTKGVDQIIPVDVYVPGCPPRPEALLQGILKLQEKIARESLGERYAAAGRPSAAALRSGLVTPPPPPAPTPGRALRERIRPAAGRRRRDLRRGGHGRAGVRPADGRRPRRVLDPRPRNRPRPAGLHLLRLAERGRRAGHRRFPRLRPCRRPGGRYGPPAAGPYDRPARRGRPAHGRRRLRGRGLARARDARDVRRLLLRPSSPRSPPSARGVRGASAAQGLRPGGPGRQGVAGCEGAGGVRARRPQAAPDASARRSRPERMGSPQGPVAPGPGPTRSRSTCHGRGGRRRGGGRCGGRPPGPPRAQRHAGLGEPAAGGHDS